MKALTLGAALLLWQLCRDMSLVLCMASAFHSIALYRASHCCARTWSGNDVACFHRVSPSPASLTYPCGDDTCVPSSILSWLIYWRCWKSAKPCRGIQYIFRQRRHNKGRSSPWCLLNLCTAMTTLCVLSIYGILIWMLCRAF